MKILLAIDGSDTAARALDFLLRFPLPEGSSVTLLTVIDELPFIDAETQELTGEHIEALHMVRNTLSEVARKNLDAAAERACDRGLAVETQLCTGDVAEEIIVAAEESQIDLLVVGSHGHSALGGFLLGSVSHRVLVHARCSVLLVKGAAAGMTSPATAEEPWRVLLAYDDSAPAREALELCAALPFSDQDRVEVVTVLPLITGYRQDIQQHMSPIWNQKKIAAKAALDGAVDRLHASIPGVTSSTHEGTDAAHGIIHTAEASGSNLIVLGNKGRRAIKRFLLGSMSAYVAHHAPCSVLVVR